MPLIELLAALFFAFLFVVLSVPAVIRLAEQYSWMDKPGKLKLHSHPVSKLGGFAIFGGVIFSVLLFVDASLFHEFKYSMAGFVILFLAGFLDDINPIPPWQKFLVQILAAAIIIFPGKILLLSFYGFLGIQELPYWISVLVTMFLLVGITNAFNVIDGIDLNATIMGLWVTAVLAFWLAMSKQYNSALISVAICGSLAAFVYFNKSPARIFLGDSGTLPTGMAIAVLLIKAVTVAYTYDGLFAIRHAPVLAFSLLAIPLFDLGRVFVLRISKGHYPFHGDRNHLHHLLLQQGFKHIQISLLLFVCSIFIFLSILLLSLYIENINVLMLIALIVTFIMVTGLARWRNKKTPVPEHRS